MLAIYFILFYNEYIEVKKMTIDSKDLLNSIIESVGRIDYIHVDEIPNIDLYMDQVTTFMEEQLKSSKRYPDDKVMTKTMINNYAKNNLLPSPVKKKYSREHILVLIFIYYFKNILSIKDIETVLGPLTEKFFSSKDEYDMGRIYEDVCNFEKSRIQDLQEDLKECFEKAEELYKDAPSEEKNYLQIFAFICNLSFDVYVKKLLIEKLVDEIAPEESEKKKKS